MKKINFSASLPVTFLREGKLFVAYTPALDLSTSGDTFEQTRKRFAEVVAIFIEECSRMGTLNSVLTDLGWVKRKKSWIPPTIVAQDYMPLNIPVAA